MPKRTKLLFAGLAVVVAFSLATDSAFANRSIEVRGAERGVQAEGLVTFEALEGGFEIECSVTLRRTVTRAIPKNGGTLFGRLTGVAIDRGGMTRSPGCRHEAFVREVHDIVPLIGALRPCTHTENRAGRLIFDCSGAGARLWKLIYDGFQGTLPRIEGVNIHIQNEQIKFIVLGPFGETNECLYEGEIFGLLEVRQPESTVARARAVTERIELTLVSGSGGLCPERGTLEGAFTIRPTLTIRLL